MVPKSALFCTPFFFTICTSKSTKPPQKWSKMGVPFPAVKNVWYKKWEKKNAIFTRNGKKVQLFVFFFRQNPLLPGARPLQNAKFVIFFAQKVTFSLICPLFSGFSRKLKLVRERSKPRFVIPGECRHLGFFWKIAIFCKNMINFEHFGGSDPIFWPKRDNNPVSPKMAKNGHFGVRLLGFWGSGISPGFSP